MSSAEIWLLGVVWATLLVCLVVSLMRRSEESATAEVVARFSVKENHGTKVAVSSAYFWDEDVNSAPIGCKLQLKTMGGVAVYGELTTTNKPHFTAWAPLPLTRKIKP